MCGKNQYEHNTAHGSLEKNDSPLPTQRVSMPIDMPGCRPLRTSHHNQPQSPQSQIGVSPVPQGTGRTPERGSPVHYWTGPPCGGCPILPSGKDRPEELDSRPDKQIKSGDVAVLTAQPERFVCEWIPRGPVFALKKTYGHFEIPWFRRTR